MPSARTTRNPRKYASGAWAPEKLTIVAVKKKAAMAGAMWVTFCITAPASPTAPALKGVSATHASPGFSTTSSARSRT